MVTEEEILDSDSCKTAIKTRSKQVISLVTKGVQARNGVSNNMDFHQSLDAITILQSEILHLQHELLKH